MSNHSCSRRARWPRRGFCAGEPQKSCPSVRSPITSSYTSARKSIANQPDPGLSRKGSLFDHLFASFKAILHFWGPKMWHFRDVSPFGPLFWSPFCFLQSNIALFRVQIGPTKYPKERDGRRDDDGDDDDGRRTDAHRIFEALLHKSPFGGWRSKREGLRYPALSRNPDPAPAQVVFSDERWLTCTNGYRSCKQIFP